MTEDKARAAKTKPKHTKALEKKLEELAQQNKEYLDKLLRLKAEFENYKKRMLKEQSLAVKYASEGIIGRLLPIIDNLDRALQAIEEGLEASKIIDGVKLTHQDIKKVLQDCFVEEINPQGEPFDPAEHEAVMTVNSNSHKEDHVVEVLQKGYKLDGKIVRPAKVSICKKTSD